MDHCQAVHNSNTPLKALLLSEPRMRVVGLPHQGLPAVGGFIVKAVDAVTNGAKKPKSKDAFMLFTIDARPKIIIQNPNLRFGEVGREIGKRWKALSDSDKKKYEEMAVRDVARVREEMALSLARPSSVVVLFDGESVPRTVLLRGLRRCLRQFKASKRFHVGDEVVICRRSSSNLNGEVGKVVAEIQIPKVNSKKDKRCNKCKEKPKAPKPCSGCMEVYYCSRECQMGDWKKHKQTCASKTSAKDGATFRIMLRGARSGQTALVADKDLLHADPQERELLPSVGGQGKGGDGEGELRQREAAIAQLLRVRPSVVFMCLNFLLFSILFLGDEFFWGVAFHSWSFECC